MLQTAAVGVGNPKSKKQVKTRVLSDQGSQGSCITERTKYVLDSTAITEEKKIK